MSKFENGVGVWRDRKIWNCQCSLEIASHAYKCGGDNTFKRQQCGYCGDQRPPPFDAPPTVHKPFIPKPGMVIIWEENGRECRGVIVADRLYRGKMRVGGRSISDIMEASSVLVREAPLVTVVEKRSKVSLFAAMIPVRHASR